MKTVLSIAGTDPSGGAGIQADIKTMTMNGVYGMSVVTALVAQNTTGVQGILEIPSEFVARQIDSVFNDIIPDAVKIGMVSSPELIEVIAEKLRFYKAKNIVIDPVMVATSGDRLISEEAITALRSFLPLASLITPNIPEAEILSEMEIQSSSDMEAAAKQIAESFDCAVLVKGGHGLKDANDFLYMDHQGRWFLSERIDNPNTHGTGCTLSSAIASNLAKGFDLPVSVSRSKDYLTRALSEMLDLGHGKGPMKHNFDLQGFFSQTID